MGVDPNQAKSIFLSAIEGRTPEEWGVYLDEVCRGDVELRQRVEALLAAHQGTDRLLDEPGRALVGSADVAEPMETPGTVIGRYKLLEKIGEGGMAVVYMAEQTEPIRRKVALKIIKLGMDTRQVIARFEAERQALAMMDHPHIAKVLDAGATETGRPYFVMELVTGVSITEYCDRNNLSTKDRLALFLQVCQAVQHAHQKGIIHRDIKPSNIMVTRHDGKPVPKVIDFGIAKATRQKLTEKTLFTRYAHIIGTPAYMSPEQAELSDLDIDTRSDIYSLGVLLYELLTGTTPFSEEELRQAGYIEMQRVIREQEPVKPSTKLSTLGETLTDIAKCRNSTPDVLRRALRGDLDWIVMKSLEKDRVRRYETANGLAEDIRRHLEHEPILACGPGAAYRVQKFLRRHRIQILAGLAMAILAVAGVIVLSLWHRNRLQLVEAEGLRHQALLSQAREQYAKADRDTALGTIQPILDSKYVGPEARLLQATVLVDNRRSDEAVTILNSLLNERPEIAGAAHSLLARILWESESPNAEKLNEVEEHRRQAEALLPETAEAYFLRAMTATTVKEQLASLDKALQLDPSHYESRRLRAFTYYASRKYERMKDDATVMTVVRPRDPLGYSLHAIAWRELGRYREAIADYDIALALTPKDNPAQTDLRTQRSETLLRMGDYSRVIAEADGAETQDVASLQYHVFCALTALGEYDKATALFRRIIAPGHDARRQFQDWCAKYVFDTLEAGRSWHPADHEPAGAAFLPLVEAEETYGSLSAKGHRLTTGGFSARWSPDGSKLAFSLGVQGYSGVAIFDPATKETELLIVPGKDPRWSPDGQRIAFVRDRQNLRLEELLTPEPGRQQPPVSDEEVWVMNADGTEPRRLAQGSWPSWGSDSQHLYYLSRGDSTLCSISLAEQDATSKQIMKCSKALPSVSPDNQRVAYFEGGSLKIKELSSQDIIAQCRMPSMAWGVTGWSPTGNEVCLGGGNPERDSTGLWLYDLQKKEFRCVLDGQITATCWSPDATELTLCLGTPYLEVWSVPVNHVAPTIEALGTGRTLDEHFRDMLAFYTRRIEADPNDAYAYSSRARYYDCLYDQEKACADMRRWSAVVSGKSPGDVPDTLPARAGFSFGEAVSLDAAIPSFFPNLNRFLGSFSLDGLEMFGMSDQGRGQGRFDIWVLKRASPEDDWGPPENLGPTVNSASMDQGGSISGDGLELYFHSNRLGGYGSFDLYVTKRATRTSPWGPATNLDPPVNSAYAEIWTSVSSDGLELYFSSSRPGCLGILDLYVSKRATTGDPWGEPVNLGPAVNSPFNEPSACLSPDGLLLLFMSNRAGGYGGDDIWMTRRANRTAPWDQAVNLGPIINSPNMDVGPCLAPDGSALFFAWDWSDRPSKPWKAPLIPIVDFNGDGIVDTRDQAELTEHLGTRDTRYDIGPMPWGDGKVDIEDLKVFTTYCQKAN